VTVVLPQELLEYIHHGREERNLEYKEHLDWEQGPDQAKLVKAVLGMSNIRDGGVVVIGVKEDGTAVGMSEEEVRRFTQDAVAAVVSEFAAPYADLTATAGRHPEDESRWFVIVQVKEFDEVPVLCKRDGNGLRKGALYTRGRRIHETAEVRSEAEMREILEMAVEKGIRAFYGRIEAAGLRVGSVVEHRQQFETQLRGL